METSRGEIKSGDKKRRLVYACVFLIYWPIWKMNIHSALTN